MKKNKGRILVVDDEASICFLLEKILSSEGYYVKTANSGSAALKILEEEPIDVVITDVRMPKMDGIELLQTIKTRFPRIEVIIITAFGTIEGAVKAIKLGAYDYITKPFEGEEVLIKVKNARERQTQSEMISQLSEMLEKKYSFDNIIGRSPAMLKIFDLIKKISTTDSTILITGESGTGKELIARAIHFHSHRKSNRFVVIDCAGLPEQLLESELFGHEKGSFTGAYERKLGLIEIAEGGTLFLDEIGELPLNLQAKLLRVIEEKEFRRIGGLESIRADVRIIAATNKDLSSEVKKGTFREDLYFRLAVIPINIPPLRERTEDILLLTEYFMENMCKKLNRTQLPTFTPAAKKLLLNYHWPGNVRELENLIEQLITLNDKSVIDVTDFPTHFFEQSKLLKINSELSYKEAKESFEKEYFLNLLMKHRWNITEAAKSSRLSRRYLHEKIRTLKITPPWESENNIKT